MPLCVNRMAAMRDGWYRGLAKCRVPAGGVGPVLLQGLCGPVETWALECGARPQVVMTSSLSAEAQLDGSVTATGEQDRGP